MKLNITFILTDNKSLSQKMIEEREELKKKKKLGMYNERGEWNEAKN